MSKCRYCSQEIPHNLIGFEGEDLGAICTGCYSGGRDIPKHDSSYPDEEQFGGEAPDYE